MATYSGYEGSVVFSGKGPARQWVASVTMWEFTDRRIVTPIRRMGQQGLTQPPHPPTYTDRVLGGQDWTGRIEFLGDSSYVTFDYTLQKSVAVTIKLVLITSTGEVPAPTHFFESAAWLTNIRGRSPIDGPVSFEATIEARNEALVFKNA